MREVSAFVPTAANFSQAAANSVFKWAIASPFAVSAWCSSEIFNTKAQRSSSNYRSRFLWLPTPHFASFSFDASGSGIFIALGSGATLVLAKWDSLMPTRALTGLLRDEAITIVTLPSAIFAVLITQEFPALQTIIVTGETCPPDLVTRLASGRQFFNASGPTETTVCTTVTLCTDETQKSTIGRAISNSNIYILDTENQPVPIGGQLRTRLPSGCG